MKHLLAENPNWEMKNRNQSEMFYYKTYFLENFFLFIQFNKLGRARKQFR